MTTPVFTQSQIDHMQGLLDIGAVTDFYEGFGDRIRH